MSWEIGVILGMGALILGLGLTLVGALVSDQDMSAELAKEKDRADREAEDNKGLRQSLANLADLATKAAATHGSSLG